MGKHRLTEQVFLSRIALRIKIYMQNNEKPSQHNNLSFRANPIGLKNNVELRIVEISNFCCGRCASCGAYNDILDNSSKIPQSGKHNFLTADQIRQNLEQPIGGIINGTQMKIHDLLPEVYTTGVQAEPLESDSFLHLAEIGYELTKERSKPICISHGLKTAFNRKTGKWENNPDMERRLDQIVKLMQENKVVNFVLSMDVARSMGEMGTENIKRKGNMISELLSCQVKKKNLLTDLSSEKDLNKTAEILKGILKIEETENTYTTSAVADRTKEKDELKTNLEKLTPIEDKSVKDYIQNRIQKIQCKLDKAEKNIEIRTEKTEVIKNALKIIENQENPEETTTKLSNLLQKITETLLEVNTRIEELEKAKRIIPVKRASIVIENNARSYFETICRLKPILEISTKTEEDKRITVSLQGDPRSDSLVSSAKASEVWSRVKELLIAEFGNQGAAVIFNRIRVEPCRAFAPLGRAKSFLGIEDTNIHCPIIPDTKLTSMYPNKKSNRGRLYMNGDLAIQVERSSRTYNDTVNPNDPTSPNPWIPVNLKDTITIPTQEEEMDEDDL